MPFLFLGIITLFVGMYFHREARKQGDKEGIVGTMGLIIAGIILLLIFGLFYRGLIL